MKNSSKTNELFVNTTGYSNLRRTNERFSLDAVPIYFCLQMWSLAVGILGLLLFFSFVFNLKSVGHWGCCKDYSTWENAGLSYQRIKLKVSIWLHRLTRSFSIMRWKWFQYLSTCQHIKANITNCTLKKCKFI